MPPSAGRRRLRPGFVIALGLAAVATVAALALPERPGPRASDTLPGSVPEAAIARPDAAPAPATVDRRPNVVLVFIDTVRADHVGAYGHSRPTTPRLDRFAATAVQFDDVHAQAPNTPRSFPSLLTGRWPSRIAWRKRYTNFASPTPANQTLFEVFDAAGYRTEVVSAHWYFEMVRSLRDGVDAWDNRGALGVRESNEQSAAPDVTARALERLTALAAAPEPFLLMVHYFDPHSRYMPHPEVADFGRQLVDLYDGELAFVDRHATPLFDALDALDQPTAPPTIVVVFSDHGEAFGEHGLYMHGRTLYEEETRVPLLVRAPGVPPRRVPERVALVDLLPTLAELAGLAVPAVDGRSLAPALRGESLPARPIYLEQLAYPAYPKHLVAVIGPTGVKVVRNLTDATIEAYDLARDPGEKRDLLSTDRDAAATERALLDEHIAGDPERTPPPANESPPAPTRP